MWEKIDNKTKIFQLFKPLTERQHLEKDLDTARITRNRLKKEKLRIDGEIEVNNMMIQHLEFELENLK